VDRKYLVNRYELDPDVLDGLIQDQIKSRTEEATSIDKRVLIFWNAIHSRHCDSTDREGEPCSGTPVMKQFREGKTQKGKAHFIACSGWSPTWKQGHRSFSIPADVEESLLEKLFKQESLDETTRIPTCSRIVRPRQGARKRFCGYPHNADGRRSRLEKHACKAYRTVFVPVDTAIRRVCIIYDPDPHNHPILPQTKVSHLVSELYRKCVLATGVAGCTIRSVQTASTTQLILNGKTPSEIHPSLLDHRKQQKVIDQEKSKRFPKGLGWEGIWHEFERDLARPESERYIHRITTSDSGGRVIFACVPTLLGLVHVALDLQGDGTFKLVATVGFDMYELTIWHSVTQRVVTVARIFHDRKDKDTY
ncbi:hypothetical protein V5O48_019192, partial [Marasmius crinis-equi]